MDCRKPHFLLTSLALIASLCFADRGLAQSQPPAGLSGAVAPMKAEEIRAVENATLADARVRAIVGAGQPRILISNIEVDKAEAEAFLSDTSTPPPARQIIVVILNTRTNKAARALVSLAQNRVLAVQSLPASDVPLVRDDADQALALAKTNPDLRRLIGDTLDRFEILESGSEARVAYAAQALPLRSTDPRDVCSVHRCLDLIFRTESGYLPVRAHVDLTTRTVSVPRRGQHP